MPVQVTIEDTAPCAKKFTIEFPADEVSAELEKTTKEFQRHAQLPGFRAGHAPTQVVRQKFSKDIEEEVKRKLIPTGSQKAVKSRHMHIIGQPRVEELNMPRLDGLLETSWDE